jgi:glycosyltransferase involved in cell wall biosynthesis/SAM-dependent methyltransferase
VSTLAGLRLAFVTYYWQPYRSGLTLHVARIAEALAGAGAEVTAIAARHDPQLPEEETVSGVRVRRLPVAARYDRAVIVPRLVPEIRRVAARADVVVLVTPIAEAAAVAAAVRGRARLAVLHVCDPQLAPGRLRSPVMKVADASMRAAVRAADLVVASSADYAAHSRILAGRDDVVAIPPPVELDAFVRSESAARAPGRTRVGYLGRHTHEKGLDSLIRAAALMRRPIELALAGDSAGIAGGGEVERLRDLAAQHQVSASFRGPLPDEEVASFYRSLDVFALPSVNSLEAWGMAQVEAMLCGTPVVASALPGVREVVERSGMGLVAPPGDSAALASALEEVARDRDRFVRDRDEVIRALELDTALERHVDALGALARERPEQARLRRLRRSWQKLGEDDARWAVLTDERMRHGGWDEGTFFATGRQEVDALLRRLSELDAMPRQVVALDFGCGVGRLTQALARHFEEVIGVDIAASMIERARMHDRSDGRCTFVLNEGDDLSFQPSASVDLVYTSRVLQHMDPGLAARYLRELMRIMRPDGTLVFQLPAEPAATPVGRLLRILPEPAVNLARRIYQRSAVTMEMHAIPEAEVRSIIGDAGGVVLHADPDSSAGPRWRSLRYVARQASVPAATAGPGPC